MRTPIRCFVAVALPDPIKVTLMSLQRTFQEGAHGISWVRPEALHITLRFLGETEEGRLRVIQSALELVAKGVRPFPVELHGLGAFPTVGRMRVLWAGVKDQEQQWQPLYVAMEAEMERAGVTPQGRPFHPHVTLARIPTRGGRGLTGLAARVAAARDQTFGSFVATGMDLMRSELRPTGAVYTVIASVPWCA